ncbi:MAG: flavodoxin family protein, partial [Candidatus Bathyarchaeia archaeon]|nr:flavodoxin family protein [Candidatus Bathyarchaeia archaeon]
MKILGISGSHRKGQNSYKMLEESMKGVKEVEPAAETMIVELAKLKIDPCIAVCGPAGTCGKEPFKCILKDDLQMVFDEMKLADGILIASPRYFIVPSKLQALIERLYCVNYMTRSKNPSILSPLINKPFGILTTSYSD